MYYIELPLTTFYALYINALNSIVILQENTKEKCFVGGF